MVNYFLVVFLSLFSSSLLANEDEQPPYISIINVLEQFIGDEQCVKAAKDNITKKYQELVAQQKDKADKIQNILKSYKSDTQNLFKDWQKLEEQKTKMVGQNLDSLLSCSSVFRTGKRVAALPGQIAQGARQAADTTQQAAARAAQATRNAAQATKQAAVNAANTTKNVATASAAIAIGVPIIAGQAAYNVGATAVNTTVNAATQAKEAAQNTINQTKEAIVETKDTYLQRVINWLSNLKSNKEQAK